MRDQLETHSLKLRKPRLDDAPLIAKYLGDYDVAKMTGSIPYPYFTLCAEFWIYQGRAKWQNSTGYPYIMTDRSDHVVGVMDLFLNEHQNFEIGYWIAKPYWGNGYATQGARLVIDEAFARLDIETIDAGYFQDNPASGRVLQKLGFTAVKQDVPLYSLTRGHNAPGIELRLSKNQGI